MRKTQRNKLSTDDDERQQQMNCSCQILNDTDLQNVTETDCSCSQCLQANLNAFNEFKNDQQRKVLRQAQSLDRISSKISKKNQNNKNQQEQDDNKSTRYNRGSHLSLNRKTVKKNNYINSNLKNSEFKIDNQSNHDNIDNGQNNFTSQNINDYILITKQRTRQYLKQRKQLQSQNNKEKQLLKQKIKQNLQILKYTVNNINQSKPKNENQPQQTHFSYKWNHKPLISSDIQKIRKSKTQSKHRINLIKKQKQQKVQTNLEKIIPQFEQNRQQILSEIKQERLQKFKDKKGCPYDHCPKHHMRTPAQDIKKIEIFIKKQAQKYEQKLKKQKQQQQQKQKIKKAKLRAIDIKCQQKLTKSKKYDPSQSRTSFHLSIDHFSTFSDLKVHKKQLDQQKKHKKEVRKMMKQKGGRLEQAIYEDLQEENQLNQMPDNTKIKQSKTTGKKHKQYQLEDQRKPYFEKIIKQAKINSPKKIKQNDAQYLKNKKQKPKKSMNLGEQKKKTKQVELQIQRKKRQLMRQYKRQKELNESKNQKIKNSHKRKLQGQQFQLYV